MAASRALSDAGRWRQDTGAIAGRSGEGRKHWGSAPVGREERTTGKAPVLFFLYPIAPRTLAAGAVTGSGRAASAAGAGDGQPAFDPFQFRADDNQRRAAKRLPSARAENGMQLDLRTRVVEGAAIAAFEV